MNEIVSSNSTVARENLRTIEASLLAALSSNIGQPMSREELSRQVWRCEYRGTTRTIDQTVATLRKKLKTTQRIVTVHRVGYAYEEARGEQGAGPLQAGSTPLEFSAKTPFT